VRFSQGVALGYLILPLQGKCRHSARIFGSLSLSKGPSQNSIFIQSLTHPALKDMSSFRGLFCFPCNSVANASASVFFRVNPWQMLLLLSFSVLIRGKCLFLIPSLTHPALKDMLLLFSRNLAFIKVYDNAHDE
jgi:hypothetical protein